MIQKPFSKYFESLRNLQVTNSVHAGGQVTGHQKVIHPDRPVTLVTSDHRTIKDEDALYFAIVGSKFDGHDFLKDVIQRNPAGLVVQRREAVPSEFHGPVIVVKNTREALAVAAAVAYDFPSKEVLMLGITGTNGKTTVTYMVETLLNHFGIPTGVIGTINHHLGDRVWPTEMTTPDPVFLQRRLRQMVDTGADAIVMEVSSHALDQRRVDGIDFDIAAFTNLTQDHLDYHGSMENYFQAKQRFFTEVLQNSLKKQKAYVLNENDIWGQRLSKTLVQRSSILKSGTSQIVAAAPVQAAIISESLEGTQLQIQDESENFQVFLPVVGRFNIDNFLIAYRMVKQILKSHAGLNNKMKDIFLTGQFQFSGVPGRIERVPDLKSDKICFVDFAHTEDGLEKILSTIRGLTNGALWTVFGCGGDRDKDKRPKMGAVAEKYSDQLILTSDNPRTEDPQGILNQIRAGISKNHPNVKLVVDRRLAIRTAVQQMKSKDVLVVAGKGHENTQSIAGKTLPFSDVEVLTQALSE